MIAADFNVANQSSIRRLLRPTSVAIVGVSPNPTALGTAVLRNIVRAGYAGQVYLINPKHAQIEGRDCLKTVEDLPHGVDCVVLAIPRVAVLDVVRACAARGVGGVIIYSAGFAEAGEEGLAEQRELTRISRETGMVVEGPNCLGMVNYIDGAPLTFVEIPAKRLEDRKGIAIISQSGAMACVLTTGLQGRDLDISFSVSTGNEAASGVEDYLEHLLDDPQIPVIAMIVEQFRQPQRFLGLARRARQLGKRIVLLHPGRSSAARASAATHTGAMAGDYQVMRVKVAHEGVVAVERLETLIDVADIMMRSQVLPSGGTVVMVESGAFKALTLDLCETVNLELPPMVGATASRLKETLPDFIPATNPLDMTAQALVDPTLYDRTLQVLVDDPSWGSIVMGIILSDQATCKLKLPPIIEAIARIKPQKPVIFAALDEGADIPMEYKDSFRALGIPFFDTTERALQAVAVLSSAGPEGARTAPQATAPAMSLPRGVIPEYRSKDVLKALGVAIPSSLMAVTLEDAQAAALQIGFPVVLKAQSPDLSHKSDVGGVVLGLSDAQSLADGWARLHGSIAAARPGLVLDGVLVEKMGARGTELIVGAKNDPEWGPVVLVGFGGVLAEALHDVRLLPPDLSESAIEEELYRLKTGVLLKGYRGSPALDVKAAAAIVAKLGAFMLANPSVAEVDINPVILYPEGQGAIALDALIQVD